MEIALKFDPTTEVGQKILSLLCMGAQPAVACNTGTSVSVAPTSIPFTEGASGAVSAGETVAATTVVDPAAPADKKPRKTKTSAEPAKTEATGAQGEQAPPPAAEEKSGSAPTLDDVREALQGFTGRTSLDAGMALLKEFGAGRISDLKPDQLGEFIGRCNSPVEA